MYTVNMDKTVVSDEEKLEKKVLGIYNCKENPLNYMIESGGRVRFVSSKEAKSTD